MSFNGVTLFYLGDFVVCEPQNAKKYSCYMYSAIRIPNIIIHVEVAISSYV